MYSRDHLRQSAAGGAVGRVYYPHSAARRLSRFSCGSRGGICLYCEGAPVFGHAGGLTQLLHGAEGVIVGRQREHRLP